MSILVSCGTSAFIRVRLARDTQRSGLQSWMNIEPNENISVAVSGTFVISRKELVSVLSDVMRDGERPDAQPKLEPSGCPPNRLAFSVDKTAEMLGVSSASVWRLLRRGLLKS